MKKLYENITLLRPIQAGESSAPRKQQGLTSQELDPQIQSSKYYLAQPLLFFWSKLPPITKVPKNLIFFFFFFFII